MELICLNCAGEFEPEGASVAPGAMLKCPKCGAEQVFFPAGGRPLPRMSTPAGASGAVSAEGGGGGAFRKPQSLAIRRGATGSNGDSEPPPQPGPEPIVRRDTDSIRPIRRPASGAVEVVAPPPQPSRPLAAAGAPEKRDDSTAAGSGDAGETWMVKSPTGLVLEFSSPALLTTWSAVVDNPAPYQVCRAGGDWMPLETFLQEVKKGNRFTQGFRVPTLPGRTPTGAMATVKPGEGGEAAASPAASETPPPSRTPTTGFTFKVANTSKPPSRGWLKPLLWAVFLLAAGAGGYFLWLFTTK